MLLLSRTGQGQKAVSMSNACMGLLPNPTLLHAHFRGAWDFQISKSLFHSCLSSLLLIMSILFRFMLVLRPFLVFIFIFLIFWVLLHWKVGTRNDFGPGDIDADLGITWGGSERCDASDPLCGPGRVVAVIRWEGTPLRNIWHL